MPFWLLATKTKKPTVAMRGYGADDPLREWLPPVRDVIPKKGAKPKNTHQYPLLMGVIKPNVRSCGQFLVDETTGERYRPQEMPFNVVCHLLMMHT